MLHVTEGKKKDSRNYFSTLPTLQTDIAIIYFQISVNSPQSNIERHFKSINLKPSFPSVLHKR